jgi:membrane associated rhomboid family serine protease
VRRPPGSNLTYAMGPGPWSPSVRAIIIANVAVFLVTLVSPFDVRDLLGLSPTRLLHGRVWELGTYLFVHSPQGVSHILFNMLSVWMFGTELERRWGTPAFTTYYFITGIGAGLCVVLISLLPFDVTHASFLSVTIGASGAVYGLLLAWAMLFPHRQILFMFIFPLPAKVFVIIVGAIAFFSALGAGGDGVSNLAHLGGLVVGWLYLKGPTNLRLDLQYRMTRWRMDRMRKKFDVHRGGRDNWRDRIH